MAANSEFSVTATGLKPSRNFRELVAVRIPDLQLLRQFGETARSDESFTVSVPLPYSRFWPFSTLPPRNCANSCTPKQMPSTGTPSVKIFLSGSGASLRINAGRPAGQNDSARLERGDFRGGRVEAQDGGIDVALADAARDDLRVLRPEIQNDDLFVHEMKTKVDSLWQREFCERKMFASGVRSRLNQARYA